MCGGRGDGGAGAGGRWLGSSLGFLCCVLIHVAMLMRRKGGACCCGGRGGHSWGRRSKGQCAYLNVERVW